MKNKEVVAHIHNGISLGHKKIMLFAATWIDLEIIIVTEVSQTEKNKPQHDSAIGIPLFIAALFTIARTWKQPRCPLTDE